MFELLNLGVNLGEYLVDLLFNGFWVVFQEDCSQEAFDLCFETLRVVLAALAGFIRTHEWVLLAYFTRADI